MSHWDLIRGLARLKRLEVDQRNPGDSAAALVAAAAAVTELPAEPLAKDDQLLYGAEAALDPEAKRIWFNRELDPLLLPVYLAHEYGHHWIEGVDSSCNHPDLDARLAEEKSPVGADRVESYSPKERREAMANVFAREFLLPAERMRTWFVDEHRSASQIAEYVGIPESIVFNQLIDVLLLPPSSQDDSIGSGPRSEASTSLDDSQLAAARAPEGPVLVEAGPGTGKTRALIGRILHLIVDGQVPPSSILVLTFSNKAAGEMRERLAQVLPAEAPSVWMGTFHAFGLEVLRKHGHALGLPPAPKLLDPVGALLVMEQLLPQLELTYYQNLYDPIFPLRDILQAISRAKDELVGPERYREMAERTFQEAADDDAKERAEKTVEVAGVYVHYQKALDADHVVDFGDLIAKPVKLLASNPDIRQEVRDTYRHILVDEYQDVNRACACFLQQLAGDGKGLWVVGDARQSIYRFRGAEPRNMNSFHSDFPGAHTISLSRNYRSQPKLVKTCASLARQMDFSSSIPFEEWVPDREDEGGEALVEQAKDPEAEGEAISREIQDRVSQGIAYRDQAVLCRSHTQLERMAVLLESNGIPILYIGDLFERPEIRDLLSLIALATGDSQSLIRLANFPEYAICAEDLESLSMLAQEQQVPFPQAITRFEDETRLSEQARTALCLLDQHLQDLTYGHGVWSLLVHYLFNRSSYLRPLLGSNSQAALQQRIAIYQFLRFASEQDRLLANGGNVQRRFLEYVRRLEIFGEEKQLRQIPEAGQAMDAVRLATVHASKGMEFRAVYLPMMGKGYVPARMQAQLCPPPTGMVTQDPAEAHRQEEICLFFVGLSRARDLLFLSRAKQYNGRGSNPSEFLDLIASAPLRAVSHDSELSKTEPAEGSSESRKLVTPTNPLPAFRREDLDLYIRCPRQYYYERVFALSRGGEDSAFLRFHRCVYELLHWVEERQMEAGQVELSDALQHLDHLWEPTGLSEHPFGALYRKSAEEMAARALSVFSTGRKIAKKDEIEAPFSHGVVRFSVDHLDVQEDSQLILRRMKTGKVRSSESDESIYGLYHLAGRLLAGGAFRVEAFSLANGKAEPIRLTEKKLQGLLQRYEDAINGILAEEFPASPAESRHCPRCPNYFVCPAMPHGGQDG